VLTDQGFELRDLQPDELRVLVGEDAPAKPANGRSTPTAEETIHKLDAEAQRAPSVTPLTLAATVTVPPCQHGAGPAHAVELLQEWSDDLRTGLPGMVIADYSTDQHSVSCRVRLVAARRATAAADVRAAITTALYNTGLVQSILVEGEGGTSAPQLPAIPVVTNVAMAAR
jgi:hypothetical protein